MVMGIFWRGTTRQGAVAGMVSGLAVTVYYMLINASSVRTLLGLSGLGLWFDIQPVSAGLFGVVVGVVVTGVVSLLTRQRQVAKPPASLAP
jgi:cation/acetate symporter